MIESNCAEPLHLMGTHGARVVETLQLRQIRVAVEQAAEVQGIVVVYGDVGLGKTFSVDLACRSLPLPVYWVDMPNRPKGREAVARVFEAVSGRRVDLRQRGYMLLYDVQDLLTDRACILVVDEAQNMSKESLRQLRYLHDRTETKFVLALLGYGVEKVLSAEVPELASRVCRWVGCRPIPLRALGDVISSYHPIFAATGPEVRARLYQAAGGNFRTWGRILEVALSLDLSETSGIGPDDVDDVLAALGPRLVGA